MWKWLLTGGLLPVLLLLCGGFFLLYLRGYPFRTPRRMLRSLGRSGGETGNSPFRSLMLALAGTLGVGNIVGVANAILIGGPGAVFWMWVSALLAMILKYAEILLAVSHRRETRAGHYGGAVYYIKDLFASRRFLRLGGLLAGAFAVFLLLDALTMGCIIQVNAVGESLREVVGLPTPLTALLLIALTLPPLLRGSRGVSVLTEYLVPIMTVGYILLSVAVLILRREALGEAFLSIFREAVSPESAAGGVLGFLTSRSLRVGTMRGLLSNEAGCGTAPTAHAEADAASPAAQGVWGILEVFVDTILLCTATALVILVAPSAAYGEGVMLTVSAYSSVLGGFSGLFLTAAVFCFGYATLLCWGTYGLSSVSFLSPKKRWRLLYLLTLTACITFGVNGAPEVVWDLADLSITFMTTLNLAILLLSRREIRKETLSEFASKKSAAPASGAAGKGIKACRPPRGEWRGRGEGASTEDKRASRPPH